jgi:hypothetical protein
MDSKISKWVVFFRDNHVKSIRKKNNYLLKNNKFQKRLTVGYGDIVPVTNI